MCIRDRIRTHLNPALRVSTILLTMFDGRTRLSAQVADDVRAHFPEQTLRTTIPRSVRVSEAPSFGETVMTVSYTHLDVYERQSPSCSSC